MKTKNANRNLIRFGALLALVAMWVVIPFAIGDRSASAEAMVSDIRIAASLTGAPIGGVSPAGFAEWRQEDDGRRRLEINASSINLPAGTVLTVSVNNAVVGQMGVSSFGTAFFRIRTQDGQSVPVITAGMPVVVTNGANTVLTGTFGSVTATPSPSGSPFPSPSPSGSPNETPSPSPSGTPNGTPSPSPSGTPNGTPSPSPSGTPNGTPSPSPTGSPNPSPSPNGGGLFASLAGPVLNGILPTGFAQFEVHSSRLELEVRVSRVNLPAGSQIQVLVDNINVGSMFLESGGEGRLRLRTDEGQPIPPIVAGSKIALRHNGANILVGIFSGASPSPSPSASPTASPSPGETPSPSPSPSPNETPSPSPSPSPSPALGRSFESNMTGAGLQPTVPTGASGEFKVTLNAAETQATIFGEFHNLSSDQTGARLEALVGDGQVIHDFGVLGGTNGNFGSITIAVTPAQVSQLRSGLWSVIITSANNSGGEIRGRLTLRSNGGDFDGDGSNDLSLYRPSEGVWYSLNSSGFTATAFGSANDKVVSADYDGDGRTDTAVFQNVGGMGIWNIKRSADSVVTAEQFGFATDVPIRGDFDGDGINDLAVFRPSTGVWYVKRSSNAGYTILRFGLAEDKPIPLDVDGDGRDDVAVYRPSEGVWYWMRSSDGGSGAARFGLAGDIPVRGDFDGDGKSDITVYRPSTGVWYTLFSTTGGFQAVRFGLDGDVPVAGKYDGDNRTDIALFRPSEGRWYILRSSDGAVMAAHFGLNGDIPTVAR